MNALTYLIEKYPEFPWNWFDISSSQNITMEFIEKHPETPWNWTGISYNKYIFQNNQIKKQDAFLLLEVEHTFHKLQNLYLIKQYM